MIDTLEFLALTIEQEAINATPSIANEDYDSRIERIERRKEQMIRNIV